MTGKKVEHNAFYDVIETSVGRLYLIFDSGVLTALSFERPKALPLKASETMNTAKRELIEYFEKGRRQFTCRTGFIEGTEFERRVWRSLQDVPYGETRSYKWMAEKVGRPGAFRAVGNALAKNPIPIIFPCHRIIESDGSIGGYTGGVDMKRRLLEIEYYSRMSQA